MSTQQLENATTEDIEGLEERSNEGWGDYPLDTVLIRNESRTVFDVVRRIDMGSFVMNPEFQRDFIWPEDKQSKLIESVLMRIPLPVFYLAEDIKGRMIVVDGLQRLSTFDSFIKNKLRLKLPEQPEIHQKHFSDLSPKLQNRIEDCTLVLYIIDAKVPERARLDIFERVNGGLALTRQQMRNCLYMGPGTRFLKEESEKAAFLQATGNSLKSSTMRNREFANRFCAFQLLPLQDYKGDMDEFLAKALTEMNRLNPGGLAALAAQFQTALNNNYRVFGKHSFRKHVSGQRDRSVLNASLYDVMSTGLSCHPESVVEAKADRLRFEFYKLLDDLAFVDAITYSPNSANKVRLRFELSRLMFKEVFDVNAG